MGRSYWKAPGNARRFPWREETPNDPNLSNRGVRRGACMVGGKAAAEAGAVAQGAVGCSAFGDSGGMLIEQNQNNGETPNRKHRNSGTGDADSEAR